MITDIQKQQFHQDGFIKLEKFYDEKTIHLISNYVNEIALWDISDDKWMMWFEKTTHDQKILSKVENFLDFHPFLSSTLLEGEKVKQYVSSLLNEDIRMLKELLIFKYPDSGGYRPHQDIYSVPHKLPHRQVHAIVMVAIDQSVPENGGLFMSKGHHKKGIIPMSDKLSILPEISKEFEWEPIHCNPGDILIFDNHTPHYSNPNKSQHSRRALYLVYQRASTIGPDRAEYNIRKRAIGPPETKEFDLYNLRKPNDIFYRDE